MTILYILLALVVLLVMITVHEFGHYLSYVALLNYYNSGKLNYVTTGQASKLYNVYDCMWGCRIGGNIGQLAIQHIYIRWIDAGAGAVGNCVHARTLL